MCHEDWVPLRDTESQTKLSKYTQELYERLEEETGQATGFIRCGSIQIAESEAQEFKIKPLESREFVPNLEP